MAMHPDIKVVCIVCGSDRFETICSQDEICAQMTYLKWFHRRRLRSDVSPAALEERATFTQDYATDVVTCMGCGLVLRNPRPKRREVERAYRQDHYGRDRLETLFTSQLELYRPKARMLRKWLRAGSRIVEVGSFVGGFLTAGQEQEWSMLGVDPGHEIGAYCESRGLPVFSGTLAEAPVQSGTLDCIAIWNTFDQLPDPKSTLAAARRLLRPGGLLALRVPNGACFRWSVHLYRRLRHTAARPFGGWLHCAMAWNNLLAFPYLYGYTLPTLDRLLAISELQRVTAHGDTLCRLAEGHNRRWAIWEEWIVKSACRMAARLDAFRPVSTLTLAPWMDTIYRLEI